MFARVGNSRGIRTLSHIGNRLNGNFSFHRKQHFPDRKLEYHTTTKQNVCEANHIMIKNAKLILFNSKKNHRPPRDDIEDPFGPIPTIEVGGRASSHRKHHTGINNTITAIDSHRVRILMPSFILVLKLVPESFFADQQSTKKSSWAKIKCSRQTVDTFSGSLGRVASRLLVLSCPCLNSQAYIISFTPHGHHSL